MKNAAFHTLVKFIAQIYFLIPILTTSYSLYRKSRIENILHAKGWLCCLLQAVSRELVKILNAVFPRE